MTFWKQYSYIYATLRVTWCFWSHEFCKACSLLRSQCCVCHCGYWCQINCAFRGQLFVSPLLPRMLIKQKYKATCLVLIWATCPHCMLLYKPATCRRILRHFKMKVQYIHVILLENKTKHCVVLHVGCINHYASTGSSVSDNSLSQVLITISEVT